MYYPPFCQLIKLIIQDENEENALTKAQNLKKLIKDKFQDMFFSILFAAWPYCYKATNRMY